MYCHVFGNTHVLSCIFKYLVILIYVINKSLFKVVALKCINYLHKNIVNFNLMTLIYKINYCSIYFNHFILVLLISYLHFTLRNSNV